MKEREACPALVALISLYALQGELERRGYTFTPAKINGKPEIKGNTLVFPAIK